jgi:arylsulfatase A-like enzyme
VPENVAKFYGMIENIDDNMGLLLKALRDWGIEDDTLVVFLTDNGGTVGTNIFNAGMRGAKVTPYQGGTRVPCFWRWPAGFRGGKDLPTFTAHIDVFPTLVSVAGTELSGEARAQVDGRNLLPLLKGENPDWPDREIVTHVGRWERGRAKEAKHAKCSVRDGRFTLVNNRELYDLRADPGEAKNVIAEHPEVVARLRASYDRWWASVVPLLENEDAVGPKVNPFKERYWAQFGGGPKP